MKMKKWTTLALVGVMAVMNAVNAFAATFSTKLDIEDGYWSDTDNLTWAFHGSGESVVIGAGPKFCDVYPEITDPEYFLKENVCYPGESFGILNSQGIAKADYTEGILPLLQEFVNSFDWIHSDEVTRLKAVHERIANGRSGNTDSGSIAGSFVVLRTKSGDCSDYSWEFAKLCNYVGLDCVPYSSGPLHAANLVKINGQWITVDPYRTEGLFMNTITVPVDFEAEYNRYENEVKNSEAYKRVMDGAEAQREAEAGEITWQEYFQITNPDMTWEELKQLYSNNGIDLDEYVASLSAK